jgi:enoyl-CoA hydratase/carnithine racemase
VVSEPGAVLAEARELAASIAAMPRVAVQAIKAASRPELGQGLDEERRLFLQSAASEDFVEGFTAFAEKRAPRFRHR